jgi:hypothetical protein
VQDRGFEASREQRAEVETVLKQVPLCESQLARASLVNAGCNLTYLSICNLNYPSIVCESMPMPLQAKIHEFLKISWIFKI